MLANWEKKRAKNDKLSSSIFLSNFHCCSRCLSRHWSTKIMEYKNYDETSTEGRRKSRWGKKKNFFVSIKSWLHNMAMHVKACHSTESSQWTALNTHDVSIICPPIHSTHESLSVSYFFHLHSIFLLHHYYHPATASDVYDDNIIRGWINDKSTRCLCVFFQRCHRWKLFTKIDFHVLSLCTIEREINGVISSIGIFYFFFQSSNFSSCYLIF